MREKSHILPQMPWTASSFWAFEPKSCAVLILSLTAFGIGEGLVLLSDLGSAPWTVLSQGVSLKMGFSVGWASFIISCIVMLLWLPLKLRLGLGTLLNVVVIALFLGLTTEFIPKPTALLARSSYIIVGILLIGIGSAFYLTCHQGAGPRDGLMVGLCQRFHLRVGVVRTFIEIAVCSLGSLLGGTLGIGTILFAISIGWVVQFILTRLFATPSLHNEGNSLG